MSYHGSCMFNEIKIDSNHLKCVNFLKLKLIMVESILFALIHQPTIRMLQEMHRALANFKLDFFKI